MGYPPQQNLNEITQAGLAPYQAQASVAEQMRADAQLRMQQQQAPAALAQTRATTAGIEADTQAKQLQLQRQKAMLAALSSSDVFNGATDPSEPQQPAPQAPVQPQALPIGAGMSGAPIPQPGVSQAAPTPQSRPFANGINPDVLFNNLITKGKLLPAEAQSIVEPFVKHAQDMATWSKDDLDNYIKAHGIAADELAPIKTQADLDAFQNKLRANPDMLPHLPPQDVKALQTATLETLPAIEQGMALSSKIAEYNQGQANLVKAQQEADPVLKLSTPEALAAPGAQASIRALMNDPKTSQADQSRLAALLPQAKVAQDNAVLQKRRDLEAAQAVGQGDPNVAGQMLASRVLTIGELKLRQATPQFIGAAVQAAVKADPTFKAAEAEAQGDIAKSEANQQFFGAANSLLIQGGLLDQVQTAAAKLPTGKIPAFNTVSNLVSKAAGQGPVAAYAASLLNLAENYQKITGARESQSGLQMIIDRLDAAQSPEQKQAVIAQFRQGVNSITEAHRGTNPYLRDMYPPPNGNANTSDPFAQFGGKAH